VNALVKEFFVFISDKSRHVQSIAVNPSMFWSSTLLPFLYTLGLAGDWDPGAQRLPVPPGGSLRDAGPHGVSRRWDAWQGEPDKDLFSVSPLSSDLWNDLLIRVMLILFSALPSDAGGASAGPSNGVRPRSQHPFQRVQDFGEDGAASTGILRSMPSVHDPNCSAWRVGSTDRQCGFIV